MTLTLNEAETEHAFEAAVTEAMGRLPHDILRGILRCGAQDANGEGDAAMAEWCAAMANADGAVLDQFAATLRADAERMRSAGPLN